MNRKKFIDKYPKIDFIQRCIRNVLKQYFVDVVRAIDRDPNLLYFVQNGREFPQHNFYDVYIDYPSKGFFALFNQTLDALKYAERFGLTPIVTWSDSCLYKEDVEINGSYNPFCYFFEQVTEFERNDLEHASRVLGYRDCQRALGKDIPFNVVSKTIVENNCYDSYIEESADVYRKYIKLKPIISEYIEKTVEQIGMGKGVLGIHVRATDFNKGYINHAVAIEKNEYIEAARNALLNGNFEQLFVATDDSTVIEDFRRIFGDKVICCSDVFRSIDGNAVHFSSDSREWHKYKLGVEVIRDMMLLAKCDGLIGGYSNVCITAQIVKKSNNTSYSYLNIIDKGFNNNGITVYQDRFLRKRSSYDK